MTCSVLDLIDGAIRQYGDAMRWSPDPQAHQPDGVEVVARVGTLLNELLTAMEPVVRQRVSRMHTAYHRRHRR